MLSLVVVKESVLLSLMQFARWEEMSLVLDIRPEPIEEFNALASRYKVKTTYRQTDVGKYESLEAGFDHAISTLGSLDGLFAAAGIAIDKTVR